MDYGHSPASAYLLRALLFAALIGGVVVSISGHTPPRPLPKTAPPREFSAERAMTHIRRIAREPHPSGSAANDKVRDYIMEEIRALGLEPQLQETMVNRGPGQAATVQNVLARVQGTAATGAVCLLAHYDSVAFGPGAADDCAGVAALLESLRAVLAGPPPKNDLIFLFTDGEEGRIFGHAGLRGAYGFVHHHPWAKEVKVAVNFDCRGVRGPSYMYECSAPNSWLVRQLNHARTKPVATSVMFEIYSRMPVASDLTMFLEEGIPGLNFAFINGLERYHTALDAPENLSMRSLQHHGDNALGMALRLGAEPLDGAGTGGNSVYFHFPALGIVQYSIGWVPPLAVLSVLVYGAALLVGLRRGRITVRRFCACLGLTLGMLALCAAAGAAAFWFVYRARSFYMVYLAEPWTVVLLCAAAALFCFTMGWAWRRFGLFNAAAAALVPWVAGLMAAAHWMPGASYIFFGPLLTSSLALLWLAVRRPSPDTATPGEIVLLALTGLPAIFFMTGIIQGLYAAVMLLGAAGLALLLLLTMGALLPQLVWAMGGHLRTLGSMCLGVAVAAVILALSQPWFTADRPKLNSLSYALDADAGRALYLSCDAAPDFWTEPYLGETPKMGPVREILPHAERDDYLRASAPVLPLEPPSVETVADRTENGVRTLSLRIDSPRGAEVVEMRAGEETRVLAARLNGVRLKPVEGGPWFLSYSIYRGGGLLLELDLPEGGAASLRVTDHSYGLPAALDIPPRPRYMIPKPNTVDFNKDPLKTDETIVTRRLVF